MTRLRFFSTGALSLFTVFAPAMALATQPTPAQTGSASSTAQVVTRGAMSIGSNGGALSFASSSQNASSRMSMSAPSRSGPSYVGGDVTTRTNGMAYNTSSGSASGHAVSAGSVSAGVQGALGVAGRGVIGGSAGTSSDFMIVAGRNQGSAVQGSTAAGFESTAQRVGGARPHSMPMTVGQPGAVSGVQMSTTGYVTGSNASGALPGMNAAGVSRIDASGQFQGHGVSR